MIVEWRQAASDDLDAAIAYLEERNPQAAYHLSDLLILACRSMAAFPNRGRTAVSLGRGNWLRWHLMFSFMWSMMKRAGSLSSGYGTPRRTGRRRKGLITKIGEAG